MLRWPFLESSSHPHAKKPTSVWWSGHGPRKIARTLRIRARLRPARRRPPKSDPDCGTHQRTWRRAHQPCQKNRTAVKKSFGSGVLKKEPRRRSESGAKFARKVWGFPFCVGRMGGQCSGWFRGHSDPNSRALGIICRRGVFDAAGLLVCSVFVI